MLSGYMTGPGFSASENGDSQSRSRKTPNRHSMSRHSAPPKSIVRSVSLDRPTEADLPKEEGMLTPPAPVQSAIPLVPPLKDVCILTVVISLPVALFLLAFSAIGYGVQVYKFLSTNSIVGTVFIGTALVGALMGYLLDCEYWEGRLAHVRTLGIIVTLSLFIAGITFHIETYSYGPVCFFLLFMVGYLAQAQRLTFPSEATRQYLGKLPPPLIIVASATLLYWMLWTNGAHTSETAAIDTHFAWEQRTKNYYARKMGCHREPVDVDDDNDKKQASMDEYSSCFYAFILWSAPATVAFTLAVFAVVAYMLDADDQHVAPKMIGQLIAVMLFGMWCSASISGAGSLMTEAVFAFILAGFVGVVAFTVYSYGLEQFKEPSKQPFVLKMKEKYGGMADPLRGLAIVTSTPVIAMFFVLSAVKQAIRKTAWIPITKVLGDEERLLRLTKVGSSLWASMETWAWTRVLVYAEYWGLFFFTCSVIISKFTVLILSVLIEGIEGLPIGTISLIFFVVGFTMFMLPPVPGVPVYLSSGIILVAAGEESLGILGSIVYAFIFSMVLKLLAVLGQMYGFGVPLGKSVSVRRAVGVNSSLVRVMKLVLSEPGLSMTKITILVGGPDWPTSVMCGILHLNPVSILLGTLPVAFLILPTVLAGSFFFLADRSPLYAVLATVSAAVAALVQSGAMLVAAYYLDKATVEHADELAAMPYDEPVLAAENAAKEKQKHFQTVTAWPVLPLLERSLLVLSVGFMIVSCYMVQLFICFEPYELTSRVDEDLPGGHWYNLMTPAGFAACGIFVASYIAFSLYGKRAAALAVRRTAIDDTAGRERQQKKSEGPLFE